MRTFTFMVRLVLLTGLLLALATAPAHAFQRDVGFIPTGKTAIVIGQSGADKADALGAATGTDPAGAMWYFGLYEDVGPSLADIHKAVAERPGLLVNIGVSFGAVSTPSPSYSAAIAAGAYDDTIRQLATALNDLPTIAYLRLGYEFDLLGGQYGPPAAYKAAYRHVVDVLREEGVDNAVYVWHSAGAFWRATDPSFFAVSSGSLAKALADANLPETQPIRRFYPGRRYVDAFGISYWQDSCCFGRSSKQARDVYESRTRAILDQAKALRLPLHISEATPAYVGANSGDESVEWLDNTFRLIADYDIRMLNLISIDWRQGGFFAAPFWNGYWPDARIHHHADTRARYVDEVSGERYIHRTADLPAQLGLGG